MSHKNITVNQNDDLEHIRPYLKQKGKRYGISEEEIDDKIKYDEETKKVSLDGIEVKYPYENKNSKAYFKREDLDKVWDDYVNLTGKTVTPKQRYEENADYISQEYKNLNNSLKEDPFSTDYALNIYKRYTDLGKKAAESSVSDSRVTNGGSVDTTALADAKRYEIDYKNQATEKIIDYAQKRADTGLKVLESFGKENQKGFENSQTERLNDIKIAKDKSDITGEVPDEIKAENPYINPKTGNVFDVNIDYQEKINEVKAELEKTSDYDEKDALIKKYNNLVDARYAKIINNEEFMPYISEGDLVSEYKSLDNKKDSRANKTDYDKAVIEAETEAYKSDNSLEGEKYAADKSNDAQKYTSLNKLKEKALEGIMQLNELEAEKEMKKEEREFKAQQEEADDPYGPIEGDFEVPVETQSYTVTSEFGPRNTGIEGASTNHLAVDIACGYGENVISAADGVVTFAGWIDGYGNTVEISHNNNIVTKYHHMAETPVVKTGDTVNRGQLIGKVGSTGISSGNHLDFQIFENDVAVDPKKYIPSL